MRLIDPIELKRAISVAAMSNNHKTLEQIIDEQPTIERKTGKWISDTDDEPVVIKDGFPDKSCYCSECREWLVASDEYAVKGNFCPNCGSYNGGDSDG